MQLVQLLHKTFQDSLPKVHKIRLQSLLDITKAAIVNSKLYLTGLGRGLSNANKTCSNIQKVDRLLGNKHLQSEREAFYKVMGFYVIEQSKEMWIHIDWTCINSTTNLYALRASISMPGRSIVIYEACYPKKKENNPATHKDFLNQLKALLPSSVIPVLVTDAGFRGPWFKYVLQLGWHFVGRLRNTNAICTDGISWHLSSTYFEQATGKPTYIGQGLLTKKGQIPVNIVLYKGKAQGRTSLNHYKKRSRAGKSQLYAKAHKEAWVLVTSLEEASLNPILIVNIYRQRMRIEENIRDTKCSHYGLGLKQSLTQCPKRMNILLLIAAIATFAAWLAGLYATVSGQASDFQAHSSKFTSVLSKVFLGREALRRGLLITKKQFERLLMMLYQLSIQTQQEIHHYE